MREGKPVYSTKTKIIRFLIWLFLLLLAFLVIFPVIYIIFGSFKENQELLVGGVNVLPKVWAPENYSQAWDAADFGLYTRNSIILALGVMIVSVLNASMAGYVFSRSTLKIKEVIFYTIVAFMFISVGSVTLRPLYMLTVKLKMNKSLLSVILISAGAGQATYIFLSRGFVGSIPKELDEAAKIDGCSFFKTYLYVILPLMKPVIGTVALLSFRHGWNEYLLPLVFTMSNPKLRPLTVGVNMLKAAGDGSAAWNIMFAGAVIAIVPMVVIYIIFNRYFVSGMTAGAVKG
ncbi:MAG: carbohydrate ABC transporter permease [Lachnospiraceae bacterium]|nr:carbohydrate ABC transporter permease [Lachnospiraceae bacterium]